MKKKVLLILIVSIVSFVALPTNTNAKTIQEFENEVAKYTKDLQEKKNKLAKNDQEVAQIKAKIKNIEAQIKQAENDINKLQEEIDASNKKIEEKDAESKKLMKYFQVVMNDNAYLEYIFGATSIKDMIYRMSVVEQLTDYNDQVMKELEALIKENNRKQSELNNKKSELKKLEADLEDQKERINADSAAVRETMPSLEEQIKAAKSNVSYYKRLGCGANEDVQKCFYRVNQSSSGSIPSSGSTLRPTLNGYRLGGLGSYWGHSGQDISSNNKKNETIYPIADGQVLSVYNDNCRSFCGYTCRGNANIVVVVHNINGRYLYATYVHLSQVYVRKGQGVSAYTPLGKMGNSGCTSGSDEGGTSIHLHLELATCHWQTGGGCTWSQYQNRILNPASYVTFPSRWSNR